MIYYGLIAAVILLMMFWGVFWTGFYVGSSTTEDRWLREYFYKKPEETNEDL